MSDHAYHVYTLSDPRDGLVRYVGCSSQAMDMRLAQHVSTAKSGRDKSKRADWIRHLLADGVRPTPEQIDSVPGDQWEAAEQKWIAHHRALGADLVNSTDGGAGSPGWVMGDAQKATIGALAREIHKGSRRSPEARARMSEAQRSMPEETKARLNAEKGDRMRNWSPEKREAAAAKLRGRRASDELRVKLSAAHQGVSEETRQKLREAYFRQPAEIRAANAGNQRGVPKSAEHRAKISAAKRGVPKSEETKQKMRIARTGTKQSPETIKKKADACRAAWQRKREAA